MGKAVLSVLVNNQGNNGSNTGGRGEHFLRRPNVSTYHGHLGSNQMLKNVGFFNPKMEILRKNRASHDKKEHDWYPQGHLVTWLFVYSVNNSFSLEYSAYIWNEPKQGYVENANQFN